MPTDDAVALESLMARYVAGDLAAFDSLYGRTAPRVFAFLAKMTDRRRAEDLCQTTFLKLHRARDGWIAGSLVMPWIMAIARNAMRDELRRTSRARVRVTASGSLPDVADPAGLDAVLEGPDEPSAAVSEAVSNAVASLSPLQKEAFVLTKHGGLSHRDAALVLGTTETAVKLRVHRAYEALRAALRQKRTAEP